MRWPRPRRCCGARQYARENRFRWARPGTGSASISRCFPPMPPRSSFACSTTAARPSWSGSNSPNIPTKSGTAIFRRRGPAPSTAIVSMGRTSLTPDTASIRNKLLIDPYARQLVGQLRWGPELFAYKLDHADKDRSFDARDSAPLMQKCRVIDPAFTWGTSRKPEITWERTIFYEMHVKGFTKLHPLVAGGRARHLCRPRQSEHPALSALARRHQRRTAADPCLCRRQLSGREGIAELLGLQFDRLLRARAALSAVAVRERIQGDGEPVSRPWHRDHPRRRLQPYRRGQRTRTDALVQGHRQRQLLPAAAEPEALLHQRHRHRQHGQPLASARAADGRGFAALLGDRDAGRRFPLRPRHHPRARTLRFRRRRRLPRCLPAGSGAVERQTDRRALGHRTRRLPGRAVPAGMGGMERQVPRYRARLLEGRRRHAAGFRQAHHRVRRSLQQARPKAMVERQLRHRA